MLTRFNVLKYSSPQVLFSDFSRAYENMRGENLTMSGPFFVNVLFNQDICVSEILIQKQAKDQPASNVAQIRAVYKTFNGSTLKKPDGSVLMLESPRFNPWIIEDQIICGIQGIDIEIMATDDNTNPRNVRVLVLGCFTPG